MRELERNDVHIFAACIRVPAVCLAARPWEDAQ
jgi:hypothetical protein